MLTTIGGKENDDTPSERAYILARRALDSKDLNSIELEERVSLIESLEKAATTFAATAEGYKAVLNDSNFYLKTGMVERAAILRTAANRGKRMGSALREATRREFIPRVHVPESTWSHRVYVAEKAERFSKVCEEKSIALCQIAPPAPSYECFSCHHAHVNACRQCDCQTFLPVPEENRESAQALETERKSRKHARRLKESALAKLVGDRLVAKGSKKTPDGTRGVALKIKMLSGRRFILFYTQDHKKYWLSEEDLVHAGSEPVFV